MVRSAPDTFLKKREREKRDLRQSKAGTEYNYFAH
jgi:hypothetical protein